MYAVEFSAKVSNGNIEIPEEFRDKLTGSVRVIILTQDKRTKADMIDRLLENPIRLEGFEPLTREEIYEHH